MNNIIDTEYLINISNNALKSNEYIYEMLRDFKRKYMVKDSYDLTNDEDRYLINRSLNSLTENIVKYMLNYAKKNNLSRKDINKICSDLNKYTRIHNAMDVDSYFINIRRTLSSFDELMYYNKANYYNINNLYSMFNRYKRYFSNTNNYDKARKYISNLNAKGYMLDLNDPNNIQNIESLFSTITGKSIKLDSNNPKQSIDSILKQMNSIINKHERTMKVESNKYFSDIDKVIPNSIKDDTYYAYLNNLTNNMDEVHLKRFYKYIYHIALKNYSMDDIKSFNKSYTNTDDMEEYLTNLFNELENKKKQDRPALRPVFD